MILLIKMTYTIYKTNMEVILHSNIQSNPNSTMQTWQPILPR